jgi:hypothetical protein
MKGHAQWVCILGLLVGHPYEAGLLRRLCAFHPDRNLRDLTQGDGVAQSRSSEYKPASVQTLWAMDDCGCIQNSYHPSINRNYFQLSPFALWIFQM